ncbi:MAG: class I SAM-dependent methyltransferase, partial [Solirubrobacterales bacterium]|nr:class I SAM-dependent methyltransferase [Solirubrobacterales bacterium]
DTRTTAARTHFDRWSRTYERDSAARWLKHLQTAALAALALDKNDVLLDLGCGTGAAVRDAAPVVRRAVGFDLSPGMIAQARDRARAEHLENVEFTEGDVSGPLPFEDGAFTGIVCTTAFHHFPRPLDTVGEMARVLGPGGRVVIADANRRHPVVLVLDLLLRALQPSHVGFRSPAQLMHDLCAAGFSSVAFCTVKGRTYAFVRGEKAPRSAVPPQP